MSLPRRGDDAGTTLAELLVSMIIGAVVLAAVATIFVGATKTIRVVQSRVSSTADVRLAQDTMTRGLRVALRPPGKQFTSAFVSATTSSVTFYSSDTAPPTGGALNASDPGTVVASQVSYSYNTTRGCLQRSVIPPTVDPNTGAVTWPAANARTNCMVFGTVAGGLFTYYSDTATDPTQPGGYDVLATDGNGNVTAALSTIKSVGITLTVTDPKAPKTPATSVADRVTLINVTGVNYTPS